MSLLTICRFSVFVQLIQLGFRIWETVILFINSLACFMNAAIQSLFYNKEFRNKILKLYVPEALRDSPLGQLQILFAKL